jgi:hypothetical protein
MGSGEEHVFRMIVAEEVRRGEVDKENDVEDDTCKSAEAKL